MSDDTQSKETNEGVDASSANAVFKCARCGRPDGKLANPPFKGTPSDKVLAHTCQGCWTEWVATGTKVINELGLVLATQPGRDSYDQYMLEFLQLDQI